MSKLSVPKYMKIFDIQKIIKYIFCNEKRPGYIQLNPKPTKMAVILINNENHNKQSVYPTENSSTIVYSIDKCLSSLGYVKAHINENITLEDLYNNFMKCTKSNSISTAFITPENIKLIEKQNIQHIFSYSNFIKSKVSFDTSIFDSYIRPIKHTKYFLIALDCEMMICNNGPQIGRISMIDNTEKVVYDKFIQPESKVIDYLEQYSGLNYENTSIGITIAQMRKDILDIIGTNTIIVGHGLENDLKAIQLYAENIIDTAYLFLNSDGHKIKLSHLSRMYFNEQIQKNTHDSREDALCCLKLLSYKICEQVNFYDKDGDVLDLNVDYVHINSICQIQNERTIYFLNKKDFVVEHVQALSKPYCFILTSQGEQNFIYFKQRN